MLATIIIFCAAFYWLLRETNYLRINLMPLIEQIDLDYKPWEDILRDKPPYKYLPDFLKMDGYEPLCGWDYLKNTMHVVPKYKFEVYAWGVRNKITLNEPDSKILKDLAVSMLRPNKDQRKELTAQRRLSKVGVN